MGRRLPLVGLLALAFQREQLLAAVRQAEAGVEAADMRVSQAQIMAHTQEKTAEVQLEGARARRQRSCSLGKACRPSSRTWAWPSP